MKAVILAAGCATRLRPYSDDTPKTLLPVGGVPILRRTITSLLRVGFDQFVIGTGYLEHMVRESVGMWFPGLDVTYVINREFAATTDQSCLHRWLTEAPWEVERSNQHRLEWLQNDHSVSPG